MVSPTLAYESGTTWMSDEGSLTQENARAAPPAGPADHHRQGHRRATHPCRRRARPGEGVQADRRADRPAGDPRGRHAGPVPDRDLGAAAAAATASLGRGTTTGNRR